MVNRQGKLKYFIWTGPRWQCYTFAGLLVSLAKVRGHQKGWLIHLPSDQGAQGGYQDKWRSRHIHNRLQKLWQRGMQLQFFQCMSESSSFSVETDVGLCKLSVSHFFCLLSFSSTALICALHNDCFLIAWWCLSSPCVYIITCRPPALW